MTRKTPKNLTFSEELLCTLPERGAALPGLRALGPIGWLGPGGRLVLAWAGLAWGQVAGWLLTALINKDIFTSSLKDDAGDGASKKFRGYSQIS